MQLMWLLMTLQLLILHLKLVLLDLLNLHHFLFVLAIHVDLLGF